MAMNMTDFDRRGGAPLYTDHGLAVEPFDTIQDVAAAKGIAVEF
jgi:hypothetical protein